MTRKCLLQKEEGGTLEERITQLKEAHQLEMDKLTASYEGSLQDTEMEMCLLVM